MAKNPVSASLL